MKKVLLFVILIFVTTLIIPNSLDEILKKSSSIEGKVIDKNTGEPLTGVSVKLTGLNLTVYSDFEGNFYVNNVFPGKYDLAISMLTYKKMKKEKFPVSEGKK